MTFIWNTIPTSRWCRIIRDLRHIHVHEPASVSTCFHIAQVRGWQLHESSGEHRTWSTCPWHLGSFGFTGVATCLGAPPRYRHRRHTSILIIHDLTRCIHPKRQTYIGRHLAFGHGRVGTRVCSVCLGIDLTWFETEKRSGYFLPLSGSNMTYSLSDSGTIFWLNMAQLDWPHWIPSEVPPGAFTVHVVLGKAEWMKDMGICGNFAFSTLSLNPFKLLFLLIYLDSFGWSCSFYILFKEFTILFLYFAAEDLLCPVPTLWMMWATCQMARLWTWRAMPSTILTLGPGIKAFCNILPLYLYVFVHFACFVHRWMYANTCQTLHDCSAISAFFCYCLLSGHGYRRVMWEDTSAIFSPTLYIYIIYIYYN